LQCQDRRHRPSSPIKDSPPPRISPRVSSSSSPSPRSLAVHHRRNPSSGELRCCCYRRPRATKCISEAPPWLQRPPHQANQARRPSILVDELGIPELGHRRSCVTDHLRRL
jgi:hypothetical protein